MTAPDTRSPAPPAYRTDLDGLRGVAIALVACFHIWLGKVSGGVDVFLTLSGYFFVASLLKYAIATPAADRSLWETINPRSRLTRLLRRLLPALLTVLIGVAVASIAILPENRWANIGRELAASAAYLQNYYLAYNAQDYLAASSANSPLQHIWSMSMQGQFFLGTLLVALAITGIIALASRRIAVFAKPPTIRLLFGTLIAAVALASFVFAQIHLSINQPFNYYDTRSRLWEPLVGGLLAVWLPRLALPAWLRSVLTVAALSLIISSGWWIDGVNEYPGAMALVPVGATLLIIWAGSPAAGTGTPIAHRLLASRPGVWLGEHAYALYLIHWPVLIFYLTYRGSDHATFAEGAGILAVSLALATLTKRFIEDPLRSGGRSALATRHWPGRPRVSYAAALTALLLVGTLAVGTTAAVWERRAATATVDTANLDPHLYPGALALLNGAPVPALDPQPSPLVVHKDLPETNQDGVMGTFEDPRVHVGIYGDPNGSRTIALAGGSHAEMWISALDRIGKRNGIRITTYLKMGCPLTLEKNPTRLDGTPYPGCATWVREVLDELKATRPDAVFTNTTRPNTEGTLDIAPPGYLAVFDELLAAGIPILGIRDTPWPHDTDGRPVSIPECLAAGGNARSCGTERATALAPVDPITEFAATRPNLHPLDLSNGVCAATFCPAVIGNIVVYKDYHHLSATYVRSLTSELSRQLADALGWTGPVVEPFS